jgi:hypothetical protein
MPDYLELASEAEDFAAWTPDSELAASYHRLAGSYYALASFHDRLSPLLSVVGDSPGNPKWSSHGGTDAGLQGAEYADPKVASDLPEAARQPET